MMEGVLDYYSNGSGLTKKQREGIENILRLGDRFYVTTENVVKNFRFSSKCESCSLVSDFENDCLINTCDCDNGPFLCMWCEKTERKCCASSTRN